MYLFSLVTLVNFNLLITHCFQEYKTTILNLNKRLRSKKLDGLSSTKRSHDTRVHMF